MYDSIATLYKEASRLYDSCANEIIYYTSKDVYVSPRSVYNSEFYNAAQAGLHPSITLDMFRGDYDGETLVKFEGKTYNVIRADWKAQRDKLSLILEERISEDTPNESTGSKRA